MSSRHGWAPSVALCSEPRLERWDCILLGLSGPGLPLLLQMKGVNLSCVRTCMVVAEERPRIALTQSFSKLFKDLGLPARAVSTTFGCRVNMAICLQVRQWSAPESFT